MMLVMMMMMMMMMRCSHHHHQLTLPAQATEMQSTGASKRCVPKNGCRAPSATVSYYANEITPARCLMNRTASSTPVCIGTPARQRKQSTDSMKSHSNCPLACHHRYILIYAPHNPRYLQPNAFVRCALCKPCAMHPSLQPIQPRCLTLAPSR
jgi:hypothetical protein